MRPWRGRRCRSRRSPDWRGPGTYQRPVPGGTSGCAEYSIRSRAVLVRLTSMVPFSLAEIGLVALLMAATVAAVRGAAALWRGPERARRLARGAGGLVAWAGVAYLVFELLWGLNYARRPLADMLG